ncbi:MAG: hypothetical protein F4W95_14665 [Chloroflexi bacterium]|nr:hypothetical protein [Chloroflexota bacterium]
MKLPNAENARIEPAKITNYLLSLDSERGRSKAKFFMEFGFHREEWQRLMNTLLVHGGNHDVTRVIETQHGTKFTVEGAIQTPDGRNPLVRTVWMIYHGSDVPWLITAHPRRR